VAEASFQGALTYARERLQISATSKVRLTNKKPIAIMFQLCARMLLTPKASDRRLACTRGIYTRQQMDIEKFGK